MAMRSRRTAPARNRFSSEEKRRASRRGRHVTPHRSGYGRIVPPERAPPPTGPNCRPAASPQFVGMIRRADLSTRLAWPTRQPSREPARCNTPRRAGPPTSRQPSSSASSSSCS
ncbi:hypothetical protein C7S15_3782 [Burkholderia cepacia]|nr:hypothetical protein [Burkholderia cepacia]